MQRMQTGIAAGLDITQVVIDEYRAFRVQCAAFDGQAKNTRIRLRQSYLAGHNDVPEPSQKFQASERDWKRSGRPVRQRMQPMALTAQIAQNGHASRDF